MRLRGDERRLPLFPEDLQIRRHVRLLQRQSSARGEAALQQHLRLYDHEGCLRLLQLLRVRVEEPLSRGCLAPRFPA
jgi:hypothetical protein